MTPEGRVRSHLRRQTLAHGGQHRKLGWINRSNAPDEFIFWEVPPGAPPLCCFVECKRAKKDATEAQAREHDRLRAGGFRVEVVDTCEKVDLLIADLTNQLSEALMSAAHGRVADG